jgi:YidC/Oxa1 family membrane protein insertase
MITVFFQDVIFRPILNVLIYFYNTIAFHNFGLAIILVTVAIRLVLYPLFHKSVKQQMLLQRIQPKIKQIQEMHKNDREKQGAALMELYKEHGVNPFSSIFLLIVQLPIMIGLYWVVRSGLTGGTITGLYSFVAQPGTINSMFLGIVDLAAPSIFLLCFAAIAQYFQARLAIYRDPKNTTAPSAAEKLAKNMAFAGPVVTILVFYSLPSAVALYWLVTSLFSIGQQVIINRHFKKGETAAI